MRHQVPQLWLACPLFAAIFPRSVIADVFLHGDCLLPTAKYHFQNLRRIAITPSDAFMRSLRLHLVEKLSPKFGTRAGSVKDSSRWYQLDSERSFRENQNSAQVSVN